MRREINAVFIHCSATAPALNIGAKEIRAWHIGQGWTDIGYHFVIPRKGGVEIGRPIERPGAHARGHNANSIGICLIGGVNYSGQPDCNFTAPQWASLADLVRTQLDIYGLGVSAVRGHREVSKKACPTFNAAAWAAGL